MKAAPDRLARAITRKESLQSYLTMKLLVDKDLVEDSYRAYAYFRWADDTVDKVSASNEERGAFIGGQRRLIEALYRGETPEGLDGMEAMVADLVRNDRGPNSRLRSYIENFLWVIEFDAERNGRRITGPELREYSDRLAIAVTDAILYFIGNGHAYPENDYRTAAARAAHVVHMLRDYQDDLPAGYWNIPREVLDAHGIGPEDIDHPAFREWVRSRVAEAREDFRQGKAYIDRLDVFRTKLAATWYCARFEHLLDAIEADGFRLRPDYPGSHGASAWLRMLGVAARVAVRHAGSRLLGLVHPVARESRLEAGLESPRLANAY